MDQENTKTVPELAPVSFCEFSPSTYEEWKKEAVDSLKGAPFEKRLLTQTYEGITLEPLYTGEHLQESEAAYPGFAGFRRGTKATGYISKPWTIAQSVEAALPAEANEILRRELERGNEAIHLELNRSSLMGRDFRSDKNGAVSEKGLLLDTLKDINDTLKDIDVRKAELDIYTGVSAVSVLGLIAAHARTGWGISHLKDCRGRIGADPIGMLAAEGELPCPPEELYDEMALAIRWSAEHMPGMRTIMINGNVYHNGGANAVQELSCCMSAAISYIRALLKRGLDIDTIAGQISFSFSIGANYFMEIAKFRAARMLWAQIVQAFEGGNEAQKLNVIAETSRFTQTIYDPYVNILRATTQAFSGIIGGVDALRIAPFDSAAGQSDEVSRRIARNIQLMFRSEFDMLRPVDAAGGSWSIESLTSELAGAAWSEIQKTETEGGIIESLKSGRIQSEIGKVLSSRLKNLSTRSDRAVGVNMYPNILEKRLQRAPVSIEDIKARKARDMDGCVSGISGIDEASKNSCLEALSAKIQGEPADIMNAITDAFLAGAAAFEIRTALNSGELGNTHGSSGSGDASVLRDSCDSDNASGTSDSRNSDNASGTGDSSAIHVEPIRPRRWTEDYERLRGQTETYEKDSGKKVRVFLANMGPLSQHKARADFTTGFMEVACFEVLSNDGFPTVGEAASAAASSGADVTVICSTDDTYPELVPQLAEQIKASCPDMLVLLAGAPAAEYTDVYKQAGVDDFIHLRSNCLDILQKILKVKGLN